jgi:hypothetical protein
VRKSLQSLILLGIALLAAGWYAFRPERALLDRRVSESAPGADAIVLRHGKFRPLAHPGSGRAELLRLPDGTTRLRLSDFETDDGPDLRVYLVGQAGISSNREATEAGFVDLGPLKGNVGDQSYLVPADADLDRLVVVAIWCRRFGVNFTEAETTSPG